LSPDIDMHFCLLYRWRPRCWCCKRHGRI